MQTNDNAVELETPSNFTPLDSSDNEGVEKNALWATFSHSLNLALDDVGFPGGAQRCPTLAKELGIGRGQCYRLLGGTSRPTLETFAVLRHLGVSVDRILDELTTDTPQLAANLQIDGKFVQAFIHTTQQSKTSLFALPLGSDSYKLDVFGPGTTIPENALAVGGIRFPSLKRLAILEDDPVTRELLTAQFCKSYQVAAFSTGHSLLSLGSHITSFAAFLMDWGLPDIDGEKLVVALRSVTQAPIFILTGDTSSSRSIAKVLAFSGVHHVSKPADEVILMTRLEIAISETPATRRLSVL